MYDGESLSGFKFLNWVFHVHWKTEIYLQGGPTYESASFINVIPHMGINRGVCVWGGTSIKPCVCFLKSSSSPTPSPNVMDILGKSDLSS